MLKNATLKGGILTLQLEVQPPKESGSGKSQVVASTHGARPTGILYKGRSLYAVANAFFFNVPEKKRGKPVKRHGHQLTIDKPREAAQKKSA